MNMACIYLNNFNRTEGVKISASMRGGDTKDYISKSLSKSFYQAFSARKDISAAAAPPIAAMDRGDGGRGGAGWTASAMRAAIDGESPRPPQDVCVRRGERGAGGEGGAERSLPANGNDPGLSKFEFGAHFSPAPIAAKTSPRNASSCDP